MKRLLLAPLILVLSSPALAEGDPNIHKMCLKAVDYKGCVKAQSIKTKERLINRKNFKNKKWTTAAFGCFKDACHFVNVGDIKKNKNLREFDSNMYATNFKAKIVYRNIVNCKDKLHAMYIPKVNYFQDWDKLKVGTREMSTLEYVCEGKQNEVAKALNKSIERTVDYERKNRDPVSIENIRLVGLKGIYDITVYHHINLLRNKYIDMGLAKGKKNNDVISGLDIE